MCDLVDCVALYSQSVYRCSCLQYMVSIPEVNVILISAVQQNCSLALIDGTVFNVFVYGDAKSLNRFDCCLEVVSVVNPGFVHNPK